MPEKTSAFITAPKPNYGDYDFGLSKYGIGTDTVDVGDSLMVPEAPGVSLNYNQYIDQLKNKNSTLQDQLDKANNSFKWDGDTMAGVAGLGSVALQFLSLPDQRRTAKLQREALRQNIATAREEQDRRNKNIASFNSYQPPASVKPSQPTSAFARQGAV